MATMKCPFEECRQYDFDSELLLYTHLDTRHTGYEVRHKLIELITAEGTTKTDMIPKSKIEAKIAFYEKDNERLKNTNFSSFMNNNDTRIQVLKELLSEK